MNKKYQRAKKIVDQIEKIRGKNNKNWMDLLRLALKLDHKKTSEILHEIYRYDQKISSLAKKIYRIK